MTPLSKDIADALHADGYHVVTRQEWYSQQAKMAVLERLYEAVKNWRYGLIDKQVGDDIGSLACAYPAIYRLAATFDEVEVIAT